MSSPNIISRFYVRVSRGGWTCRAQILVVYPQAYWRRRPWLCARAMRFSLTSLAPCLCVRCVKSETPGSWILAAHEKCLVCPSQAAQSWRTPETSRPLPFLRRRRAGSAFHIHEPKAARTHHRRRHLEPIVTRAGLHHLYGGCPAGPEAVQHARHDTHTSCRGWGAHKMQKL